MRRRHDALIVLAVRQRRRVAQFVDRFFQKPFAKTVEPSGKP
jgi:hypothetical protein